MKHDQQDNIGKFDVVVIGSGYGGLAAALDLAERGVSVALFEMLKYAGGCASTFQKDIYRFETGATLFSGFHEAGLFTQWIKKHNMPVQFELLDPIIDFRTKDWQLSLSPDREKTIERFCSLPHAPAENIRRFFFYQKEIADTLWPLFEDAARLPPFQLSGLSWHMGRFWKYPKLLPVINRSLFSLLQKFQLADFKPLVEYCNALTQITIQCSVYEAEALFALSAMDYLFRGTGHIQNGIGELSQAMIEAIRGSGGQVFMSNKIKKLEWKNGSWLISARKGTYQASKIIANLLPPDIAKLVPDIPQPTQATKYEASLSRAWGAGMLYLVLKDSEQLPSAAHHYQCISSSDEPLSEGNHIFCSLSSRDEDKKAPSGYRTATVSTHIPMPRYLSDIDRASYIQKVQERMRKTIQERLPEIAAQITKEYPASPRTYQRFTNRSNGFVGGIPRTKGWHNYQNILPKQLYPNLWIAGDTSFPGQSTLATALGGIRIAQRIA